ncbi:MAG: mannose-1-phosphate guanylyltransferase [Treponema sp.]|jgi:mannose-1-phosphate guanylyltransferase|nr:mannose-1-phosphate guanylyltransferase [Treponema sp.]
MFQDCIIMAGGSGVRLWPASTSATPKQFLAAPGGGCFFSLALERALAVIDRQRDGLALIIAGERHIPRIAALCAALSPDDQRHVALIVEAEARNTAPAIACGTVYLDRLFQETRNVLVLASDHIINPLPVFQANAAAAALFAEADQLAVFGIPPRSPETGYGYIETAEALPLPRGGGSAPPARASVFRAASFREKPGRALAERFLASGRFYWNSGMFGFNTRFIQEEFQRRAPESYLPFTALARPGPEAYRFQGGVRILENWKGLAEAYQQARPISFDYALAEGCRNTVMAAADFAWLDVGSWDEYAKLLGSGQAEVYAAQAENCFVDADIPVALCGVRDLIVAVRTGKDGGPPAVLISQKGETQLVREIVERIRGANRSELL